MVRPIYLYRAGTPLRRPRRLRARISISGRVQRDVVPAAARRPRRHAALEDVDAEPCRYLEWPRPSRARGSRLARRRAKSSPGKCSQPIARRARPRCPVRSQGPLHKGPCPCAGTSDHVASWSMRARKSTDNPGGGARNSRDTRSASSATDHWILHPEQAHVAPPPPRFSVRTICAGRPRQYGHTSTAATTADASSGSKRATSSEQLTAFIPERHRVLERKERTPAPARADDHLRPRSSGPRSAIVRDHRQTNAWRPDANMGRPHQTV